MEKEDILKEIGERLQNGEELISIKADLTSRGIDVDKISYEFNEPSKSSSSILKNLLSTFGILFIIFYGIAFTTEPGREKFFEVLSSGSLGSILGYNIFLLIGVIFLYFGLKAKKSTTEK